MKRPDSIKARLKALSVQEHKPYDYLMMYYFIERLLYRLSVSGYADNLVLKGGVLLYILLDNDARATTDIDFLAQRLANTLDGLIQVFREICSTEADDAIRFDLDSVTATRIKEDADYEGMRIKVTGYLDKSRHVLQFNICFGDVIVPKPLTMDYPSLLNMERPRLKAYSHESVIAEKLETMIALAEANSRIKDFYDVYMLSRSFDYEGPVLCEALRQTLERRATPLTAAPAVFSNEFRLLKDKQAQWRAFQRRIDVADGVPFSAVIDANRVFLQPVYQAVLDERDFFGTWRHELGRWKR